MTSRRRWILTTLALLCVAPYVRYRLPGGAAINVEAEVQYQLIDIGQRDHVRWFFEGLLGNRRLFLVNRPPMYVTDSDFRRCWPQPRMKEADYAIQAKLKTYPLLFGGYDVATLVSVERLSKPPEISK